MKISNFKTKNCKGGYSLVELIFYVALFSIVSLFVINSMIVMAKSFRETTIQADLMKGGDIMERISREVRRATSVASISSSDLKINTKDDAGVAKTIEFVLSGSDVHLLENDVLSGNLNIANIVVSVLTFSQITTTKGTAVKMVLTINSKNDTNHSESFYDTVVLRGDY